MRRLSYHSRAHEHARDGSAGLSSRLIRNGNRIAIPESHSRAGSVDPARPDGDERARAGMARAGAEVGQLARLSDHDAAVCARRAARNSAALSGEPGIGTQGASFACWNGVAVEDRERQCAGAGSGHDDSVGIAGSALYISSTCIGTIGNMEYFNFGSTGLKVSRLALGTMSYGSKTWRAWTLEEEESRPFFKRALDLGINFFDTADIYSFGRSEEILGRALTDLGVRRDRTVIATKAHLPMSADPNDRGLSRKHLFHSIDASLKRLGTDYVDLYQIHRWDASTPIEETLMALHDIVKAGKALYIGASTMSAWQFAKMLYTADRLGITRPVSMQPYYNLLYREEEREMIPLCRAEGIALIPYSPIARGFVTGQRRKEDWGDTIRAKTDDYMKNLYYSPQDFAITARITEIAGKRGVPNVQVALAWVLQQPGITAPIVGVTRLEQLDELVGSLALKLDPAELQALSDVYQPHEVVSDLPRPKT